MRIEYAAVSLDDESLRHTQLTSDMLEAIFQK